MSRHVVEVVAALGIFANLLDAKNQADNADDEKPPELPDKRAQSHDDAGGQRQGDAKSDEQVGEDRNNPLQQGAHDQERQTDHRNRIDQGGFHRGPQLDRFFDVDGQALQNDVENTAGFAGLNHVGGEVVENLGILRMAFASVAPPSTVVRTPLRVFWNAGFS